MVYGPSIGSPFLTGYGIYDVKENKFYGLEELSEDKYDDTIYIDEPIYDYSKYDGLIAVLTELDIGYKRGDANIDTNVDILDATEIQKVSVDKVEFSKDQVQIADVNDDEKADILDATAIQRYAVSE